VHLGFSLLTFYPRRAGGLGSYVNALLDEFGRGPEEPERMTVFTNAVSVVDLAHLRTERLDIRVVPSFRARGDTWSRQLAMARGMARSASRDAGVVGDIDLMHYPVSVPLPKAASPAVYTLHDVQHHDLPEFFSLQARAWRRFTYDRAAQRADRVITVSEHARSRIIETLGIPGDRVDAIHHGIDMERFTPQPGADEEILSGLDLPERFLFYPAGLWPHKNHEALLGALTAGVNQDIDLVLCGPTLQRLGAFSESVRRRGLSGRVHHLGFIRPEALAPLYRRACALVFPSLYEGFGLPPLEAMACGCPVACSSAASLAEICGDAALLFDPREPGEVESAVNRVADDEGLRSRLRDAGLRRAGGFTWENAAREHRGTFLRALRSSSSPKPEH
jgi:glycosyltransferase involved in cell wall biosynthesis